MEDVNALIQQQLMRQYQAQQQRFSLHHQLQPQLLPNSFNSPPLRQHNAPNPNPNPSSDPPLQLAYQDAWKVCHPDFKRPFSSLEDACQRLLPYHVVADYEDEDEKILDSSDTTGQTLSRSRQWDSNIVATLAEFTSAFEKQVQNFNEISRMRDLGELRLEERLMIEKCLMLEEKEALYKLKTEIESRERDNREAQFRIACASFRAEQARGDHTQGGNFR